MEGVEEEGGDGEEVGGRGKREPRGGVEQRRRDRDGEGEGHGHRRRPELGDGLTVGGSLDLSGGATEKAELAEQRCAAGEMGVGEVRAGLRPVMLWVLDLGW